MIDSWLDDPGFEFQLRPGEQTELPADDPRAMAQARTFRDVLGRFASGVTVVTTLSDGEPIGMTCQSFTSVSLQPPLVLFCPARTSLAWPRIHQAGRFCVNFLADHQADVSTTMATRGIDKFAGVGWEPSPATGSPLLHGVLGHVDCSIHAVHEAGDHYVVIGRVLDLAVAAPGDSHALTFFRGRYGSTRD